ncbi:MAG: alpha/beta hydrolase [Acidimicrobiia bacterium]
MGSRRLASACVLVATVFASFAAHALPTAKPAIAATAVSAGRSDSSSLDWRSCHAELECADLTRPAHLDDPAGPTISLAVARIPAADPTSRIGVLMVNPGGPGVSGIAQLAGIRAALPTSVQDRFDLVAFDPRGTGATTPIDCGAALDPVFDLSFSPATVAQRDALVAAMQDVATSCAAHNGTLLRDVSSVTAARDMDAVRDALGERQLNYLGYSYGTYLGALYAALFPERVRALVLDGAIDPTLDAVGDTVLQATGFEKNLDKFLAWCSEPRDCEFGATNATRAYDALRRRVAAEPIAARGRDGRALNDTRFDAAVLQLLYGGRASWPALASGLAAAADGDGGPLLRVADRFLGREPGGGDDGSLDAFWAVSCLDDPSFGDVAQAAATEERARQAAPRLGAFVANFSLACSVWSARTEPAGPSPADPVPAVTGVAPDALVVGGTADPATPLVSAKRLARELGGASLVVATTDQHTAVGSGIACVDRAFAEYLLEPRSHPGTRRC